MEKIHIILCLAVFNCLNAADRGDSRPMPPPDLSLCHYPIYLPESVPTVNCCPPYLKTAIDFEFPANLPVRIRPSAHTVDNKYIEKYSRAVQIMKQLPSDDPRSFVHQANVHCAYCEGAYNTGDLPVVLNVHASWFFLAWHRWYLYFHERILATLIGDDSFALPFWNWDGPSSMSIPPMYVNEKPLFDTHRDPAHQPPTPFDFNYDGTEDNKQTLEHLIDSNNHVMYRHVVSNAKTARLFHGIPFRYGDNITESDGGPGTLENSPHNPAHNWIGSRSEPDVEDMGVRYSAARDPIFFAHHANVDRIWTIWKTLDGGTRRDYSDPDFLEARFLFYNENSQLVSVKLGDALDPSKLRYAYQSVDMPWINWRPLSIRKAEVPWPALDTSKFGKFGSRVNLTDRLTVSVKRPKPNRSEAEKQKAEEVLLIDGIKLEIDRATKFDVFINLPEANSTTSICCAEYAGTFFSLPQPVLHFKARKIEKEAQIRPTKSSFRLGITGMLEELNADRDQNMVVTLVHKGSKPDPIEISSINIIFDNSGLV